MESVIRQFNALTEKPVLDEGCGEAVDIVGLSRAHGKTRITVVSTGQVTGVYTTDLSELHV
jgi:hypothetical protein